MNAYIYLVVICVTTATAPGPNQHTPAERQQVCLPAGNPFVGNDPEELCRATAINANKRAAPGMEYFCVRRKQWESVQ